MTTATSRKVPKSVIEKNNALAASLTRKLRPLGFRLWGFRVDFSPKVSVNGDEASLGHLWHCRWPGEIERGDYEDDFNDFMVDDRDGTVQELLIGELKKRIRLAQELVDRLEGKFRPATGKAVAQ
jgi:hypothetical protein